MSEIMFAEADAPVLKRCSGECYHGTYTLNVTFGCSHNCAYCYVASIPSNMKRIKAMGGSLDRAAVKKDVVELVDNQLASIREKPVLLRLSTMSDVFQPAVKKLGVSSRLFEVLNHHDVRVYMMTKNVPDKETMKWMAQQPHKYHYVVTCANVDPERWRMFESGSAPPQERFEAAKRLIDVGVTVEVDMDPLIPGFDDSEEAFRRTVGAVREAGIEIVNAAYLFLRPSIVKRMRALIPKDDFNRLMEIYARGSEEYLRPSSKGGKMQTLPMDHQAEKFSLLSEIVRQKGLSLRVCSKKNGRVAEQLGLDMCSRLKLLDYKFNLSAESFQVSS